MIGLMEAWMDFLLGEWVVGWPGNCFGWLIGFMSDWVDNWWEGCLIGWMGAGWKFSLHEWVIV